MGEFDEIPSPVGPAIPPTPLFRAQDPDCLRECCNKMQKPQPKEDGERCTPFVLTPKIYSEVDNPLSGLLPCPHPTLELPNPILNSSLSASILGGGSPSAGTRSRWRATPEGLAHSTVALPLKAVGPPPADQNDLQLL